MTNTTSSTPSKRQKLATPRKSPLILQVLLSGAPAGLWVHPKDQSRHSNDLETWLHIAKVAERGKLNALFLADHLSFYDSYDGPHNYRGAVKTGEFAPRIDPGSIITAMASVTESLGFGVTFSTISEHPYHFARRLASLDHFTNGRVAWNLVTSFLKSIARQIDEDFLPHDERYFKSQEYLDVVLKLLISSWRDDAVVYDKERGVFAEPDRVREINHVGKYFNVPGPAITEPTPQRFPVLFQAGTSNAGILFAAENAEMIFIAAPHKSNGKEKIKKIRSLAKEKFNRDPYSIKIIAGASFHVGKTHEEAVEKLRQHKLSYPVEARAVGFSGVSDIDLSKFELDEVVTQPTKETNALQTLTNAVLNKPNLTKRQIIDNYDKSGDFVGTPEEIGDQIEEYVNEYDIDGFNVKISVTPTDLEDFVDFVVPELQKRGLFWNDYNIKGGTLRQNTFGRDFFTEDHPAYGLKWSKGESLEDFEEKITKVERERVERREEARKDLGLS